MSIATDDRARVAQALREMETPTWPTLTEAVMGHVAGRKMVVERLADLIEPPRQCPHYHSDRHYCSAYDDVVDRDALLALADELEEETGSVCGVCMGKTARRIRDACGVTQDD